MDENELKLTSGELLRKKAEDMALKSALTAETIQGFTPSVIERLLYELQVHQIELEMQNIELRRAYAEIEKTRSHYFDLYDMAPVGYFTVNAKGTVLKTNITAASMLSVPREKITGNPLSRFIIHDDQDILYMHHRYLSQNGPCHECELRMSTADNKSLWVRMESAAAVDDDGNPIYRTIISNITERKIADDKIKKLLSEKELLLKEVHHRVKNNMMMISSMILLQIESASDTESSLIEILNRVKSMMILYENLSQSGDISITSVKNYLSSLVDGVLEGFPKNFELIVEKNIEDFGLNSEKIMPLGLIVNEILTNAMKHAFKDRQEGKISICASLKDNQVTVSIRDNGTCLPNSVCVTNPKGIGFIIIKALTEQLNGSLKITYKNGMRFLLKFNI